MNEIGHNNPPSITAHTIETTAALNDWLKSHPVIQTEDEAREAKLLKDRADDALRELKVECDGLIRPLNDQIGLIRSGYAITIAAGKHVVNELVARLSTFVLVEETKRKAEAETKRLALEEMKRIAQEAEAREKEAIENAKAGEVVDVAAVTSAADQAFAEFKHLERESARADKATHVKIGGGFRRAVGLRAKESLILDDATKALAALGITDKIRDAILTEARAYRTQYGELPPGVSSEKARRI
jgi:hypothetical protein